jgi:hypothetical protein
VSDSSTAIFGSKPENLRALAGLQGAYPIFVEPLKQAANALEAKDREIERLSFSDKYWRGFSFGLFYGIVLAIMSITFIRWMLHG